MRFAIAGGNGFIGRELTRQLLEDGHEVTWLSHRPGKAAAFDERVVEVPLDPSDADGATAHAIRGADGVANLSGYPIATRWNPRVKELLKTSRVDLTSDLVARIADARQAGPRPSVLVNASAVGIYGDRADELLGEDAAVGGDWLADLAVAWEAEAQRAAETGCREVRIRTGLVLGDEGLLPRLVTPMLFFVGGPVGTGEQWVSWIHIEDIAGVYRHALICDRVSGALNAGAPEPVTMREFSAALGRVLGRPSWLPVPTVALRLILGEVTPYTLMSQRLDSSKLVESGFVFRHGELSEALADLVG